MKAISHMVFLADQEDKPMLTVRFMRAISKKELKMDKALINGQMGRDTKEVGLMG